VVDWKNVRRILLVANGGWMDSPIEEALRRRGCEVKRVEQSSLPAQPDPRIAAGCDFVLCHGPNRTSMLPAARLVSQFPAGADRPLFVWWLAENLPDPRLPAWFVDRAARLRVGIGQWSAAVLQTSLPGNPAHPRAHRLRVLGELHRIRSLGALDVLPVAGSGRTDYLRQRGFDAFPVFIGCHPVLGRDLGIDRDLDVVFVGQPGTRRRRALLRRLKTELAARGIDLRIYDGVRASLYGEERTQVLNRSKICLNVLKAPHDAVAYRLLVGAANKALIVSEPLRECTGFEPERHLVTRPIDRLADAIEFYLRHEAERRSICEAAYHLVTRELTMERAVGHILERSEQSRGVPHATPTA
jgi:hypothetical protein